MSVRLRTHRPSFWLNLSALHKSGTEITAVGGETMAPILLRFAPFVRAATFGMSHPLDQRLGARIQHSCPTDSLCLRRKDVARPLRVWLPDGVIALLRSSLHE